MTDINQKNLFRSSANIIYFIVSYCLVFPIFRLLFRGHIIGNNNVPLKGPLVIVSNHGSHLDPPVLGHVIGRKVSFMAKAELFEIPLLGPLIKSCAAYPVKRGSSDREAIRTATKLLNNGEAIGIFLDGTRQQNGRVNNPMHGAALLSARTGSYLLPVAIINSHRALGTGARWPRLMPIHVRIGKIISPPATKRKPDLEVVTKQLQYKINSLIDEGLIIKNQKL